MDTAIANHKSRAKSQRYAVFQTSLGWMGVCGSERGLSRLVLPQETYEQALRLLNEDDYNLDESRSAYDDLVGRLERYFSGQKVDFADTIDLSDATPFEQLVWKAARLIPHGETRSYSWLADKIGRPRASRAVGQALGKNPLPLIVPCHRVLASDGSLCGFSAGLGMKRKLLELEAHS
jgi:methylated-DNA-[protein]-cysteine S-methyltransferase